MLPSYKMLWPSVKKNWRLNPFWQQLCEAIYNRDVANRSTYGTIYIRAYSLLSESSRRAIAHFLSNPVLRVWFSMPVSYYLGLSEDLQPFWLYQNWI